MDGEERLTVRLSSDNLILLNELVYRGKYTSVADAIKSLVTDLLESQFTSEERIKIIEEHKSRRELNLNDFTSDDSDASDVLSNVIVRGLDSDRK